jgi:hypothetical protein
MTDRLPVSGEPRPKSEPLQPEHVIDRNGFVWRVVRDGGMATRADYTGQTSIGIEELRATHGPLVDLEQALADKHVQQDHDLLHAVDCWCNPLGLRPDANSDGRI